MLWKRVLTAVIILPPFCWIVVTGGQWLAVLSVVMCVLAMREWLQISCKQHPLHPVKQICLYVMLLALLGREIGWLSVQWSQCVLPVGLLGLGLMAVLGQKPLEDRFHQTIKLAFAILYCGGLLPYLYHLRQMPHGLAWVFLTLISIWVADSGAYFVGRRWGRRRLAARVSPNKTIEGVIGGLVAALLAGLLVWRVAAPTLQWFNIIAVTLLAAGLGVFGDLFESMFKRTYNVKDSSGLLPGHGGILDRCDSMMFALPGVYVYLRWIQHM